MKNPAKICSSSHDPQLEPVQCQPAKETSTPQTIPSAATAVSTQKIKLGTFNIKLETFNIKLGKFIIQFGNFKRSINYVRSI